MKFSSKSLLFVFLLCFFVKIKCNCPIDVICPLNSMIDDFFRAIETAPDSCLLNEIFIENDLVIIHQELNRLCPGSCGNPNINRVDNCRFISDCPGLTEAYKIRKDMEEAVDNLPQICFNTLKSIVSDRVETILSNNLPPECQVCETKLPNRCDRDLLCKYYHFYSVVYENINKIPQSCLEDNEDSINDILDTFSNSLSQSCPGSCSPPEELNVSVDEQCDSVDSCNALTTLFKSLDDLNEAAVELQSTTCYDDDDEESISDAIRELVVILEESNCGLCNNNPIPANCTRSDLCEYYDLYHSTIDSVSKLPNICLDNKDDIKGLLDKQIIVNGCPGSCNSHPTFNFDDHHSFCETPEDCVPLTDFYTNINLLRDLVINLNGTNCFTDSDIDFVEESFEDLVGVEELVASSSSRCESCLNKITVLESSDSNSIINNINISFILLVVLAFFSL
eukprot:TRINITY_DN3432_c0_g1_i2.p1 TRINITY_DN3432_c0_g1~~TRINITY_DN3432_c0_g1_i2.p1  ORF type:complete len:451 (+),score=137.14 TRINITY_DN3432_c0_g1_i2:76-1428(+)